MNDFRLALMCGTDIPVPHIQLTIHQPRIREIALIGETDFFVAVQCLNVNKDLLQSGRTVLQDTSNFQIFMMIMSQEETKDKKDAIKRLFSLLFPNYSIIFTPRSIMLQKGEEEAVVIDETNFDAIQDICKEIFCLSRQENQQISYNPANERARQIAEKIMKGRQKVAELNGAQKVSIFTQYLSILAVGLGSMSLQDLMNLTMFQLYDLIERYQLYLSWDIDIRSRLAGAKMDDKPDNWMKNIH